MRMRQPAAVVAALVALLVTMSCSPAQRVDLGQGAGNLIAAIAGEPDQLDPHKTSAYFSFEVLENVFDTLVAPDANLEMRPALAQSWDVSPAARRDLSRRHPVHRRRRRLLLPADHRREARQLRQVQRRDGRDRSR